MLKAPIVDRRLLGAAGGLSAAFVTVGFGAGFDGGPSDVFGETGALTDEGMADIRLVRVWLHQSIRVVDASALNPNCRPDGHTTHGQLRITSRKSPALPVKHS